MIKKVDLTTGNVWRVLIALAVPLIGGSLLQFTYNIVDMFWVGALGSDAIASVGTSTFYIGLGYAINALVVVGTGIKVSHAVGRKDEQDAKGYIHAGSLLNGVLGLLFALILIGFGKEFIAFLNINDPIVEREGYTYLSISAPMMFFAFFNILYARIFSSYGNTKAALKINAVGLVLNMILDPLFIYGLDLGVKGAAIATLVANGTVFILFLYYGKGMLSLGKRESISLKRMKTISRLGFPMALQRVLFTIVNILLARMVGSFGAEAIAAQRIGLQVESIAYMIIGGLNGAISSYVGQNYGARKYERIREGYRISLTMGISYSFVVMILFLTIPQVFARIFVDDVATIDMTANYLRIIGLSLSFAAIEMISNGVFTGLGLPKISATISIIFTIIRIPMAFVFIPYLGVNGIWWSISVSSMLKGIAVFVMYKLKVKEVLKS